MEPVHLGGVQRRWTGMARRRKPKPTSFRMPAKEARKHDFAARMRNNPTPAEQHLLQAMTDKGWVFAQQQVLNGYIVDFFFPLARVVVEVDGAHHFTPKGRAYDKVRTAVLFGNGYRVLRFSNSKVLTDVASCLRVIENALQHYTQEKGEGPLDPWVAGRESGPSRGEWITGGTGLRQRCGAGWDR